MFRGIARQVFLGQREQPHRRAQTTAVLGMRWMFEIFLQMDKCARGLDQSLEKIIVSGVGIEPEMLQDVVRFVVTLVIPATKISAVERMVRYLTGEIGVIAFEVADELRNSFAFVHEPLNFTMPKMMGKPTFLEGTDILRCHKQE